MAAMIPLELLFTCLVAAGLYLLIVSLLLDLVERRLRLTAALPEHLVEKGGATVTLANFVLELLFYVVIPTIIYSFFYYVFPFYGVRAGLAAALFAFMLGAAPAVMGLSLRVKLPVPYLLYQLFAGLLKLLGSLAIIAYIHTL
jgi:hypothetical protein